MDKPFFSVIVPAHNSAAYIRKGLDSIRNQTFRDYELIVVCDKCTDDTVDVARQYADFCLTPDFGHDGLARNAGIDIARGEWLLFMDDDDWFLHEYVFQQIYSMAGKHGENILAFSFIWKNMCYMAQTPDDMCVAVWNKCWKRAFVGDTRFTNREWACDTEFHRKMFRKGPTVYYWDMPMYYYNFMRPGSQTWKMQREILREENKMSLKNGVWHDAKLDPPGASWLNKPVLSVREIGEGKRAYRKVDISIYNASVMHAPSCTWEGKWNKRGVIYWMPMPEIPED